MIKTHLKLSRHSLTPTFSLTERKADVLGLKYLQVKKILFNNSVQSLSQSKWSGCQSFLILTKRDVFLWAATQNGLKRFLKAIGGGKEMLLKTDFIHCLNPMPRKFRDRKISRRTLLEILKVPKLSSDGIYILNGCQHFKVFLQLFYGSEANSNLWNLRRLV